jgi:hypothetical protein
MASRRRLVQRFAFASHAVHHHRFRRRPVLEVREDRVVLATFTVNSLGDGGIGSNDSGDLRYCINIRDRDAGLATQQHTVGRDGVLPVLQ